MTLKPLHIFIARKQNLADYSNILLMNRRLYHKVLCNI